MKMKTNIKKKNRKGDDLFERICGVSDGWASGFEYQ